MAKTNNNDRTAHISYRPLSWCRSPSCCTVLQHGAHSKKPGSWYWKRVRKWHRHAQSILGKPHKEGDHSGLPESSGIAGREWGESIVRLECLKAPYWKQSAFLVTKHNQTQGTLRKDTGVNPEIRNHAWLSSLSISHSLKHHMCKLPFVKKKKNFLKLFFPICVETLRKVSDLKCSRRHDGTSFPKRNTNLLCVNKTNHRKLPIFYHTPLEV